MTLRRRLTTSFAVGMIVVLVGLGAFVYAQLKIGMLRSIDMGLRSRAEVISSGIGQGGFADGSGSLVDPSVAFAQILDASGRLVESSESVAGTPLVSRSQIASTSSATFVDGRLVGSAIPVRLLVVPADGGLFIVVGTSLADMHEALTRLLVLLAIGGAVSLVATCAAGWALTKASLRPVERMRIEAAAISGSDLGRRLPDSRVDDELSRLAATLNDMLARLQEALVRERRFVDDASHELRTPLAVLRAELELAVNQSRSRSRGELLGTIRRSLSESDHITHLAEDLLVLARANRGLLPVHPRPIRIKTEIDEACSSASSRAQAAGVRLEAQVPDVVVQLDGMRLRQALWNLLDNAIRYSPTGGSVRLAVDLDGDVVQVVVEDDGPGFQPEFLADAFEPFARPAASHPDGAGLGLSIVRAVAHSHGGSTRAENKPDGGARVVFTLRSRVTPNEGRPDRPTPTTEPKGSSDRYPDHRSPREASRRAAG